MPAEPSDSDIPHFFRRALIVSAAFTLVLMASSRPALAAGLSTPDDPNIWSILPPVLAIAAALAFRQVIPALFAGVWLGAWFVADASFLGLGTSFLATFQVYFIDALADPDHAAIIAFSLMIGAMVGIISKNGGLEGIVTVMVRWANSHKRAQLSTGFLGLSIFFDDYANTLIVGNTMRPVTDHHNVSRAKLAYLVDSTAAPVACVALVTTWVGYEVGLIDAATQGIGGLDAPYILFLKSIGYSFYPLLAIAFVFMIAGSGRDFGPMRRAEEAARRGDKAIGSTSQSSLQAPTAADMAGQTTAKVDIRATAGAGAERAIPRRAINALGPILVLLTGVMGGLLATGEGETLTDIIATSDSYKALLWGSLMGATTAGLLTLGQRIMTLDKLIEAALSGIQAMILPMIILILAWSMAAVTGELGTANYLILSLSDTIPYQVMPALVFLISAATAFATGSSWGVMGILMPLAIPLVAAQVGVDGSISPEHLPIVYSTVASVLAGSVWGDHCSPISDTTILSSMASGCDHIEHVRTQMPYALLVGGVAILAGTLPAGFGLPWWAGLVIGGGVLFLVLKMIGRSSELVPQR